MARFKIIKNREALSSKEITNQMNFDKFISGYSASSSLLMGAKSWLIIGAGAIAVSVVAIASFINANDPKKLSRDTTRAFVAPPLPQMNIKSDDLFISGNSDTTINYPSGTKVFIPANSFVDMNNKPVEGPYKISFREFHDQIDQLLSGIPMVYDSAGIKKQFESAGMFEILGFKEGEPIQIKKDKQLVVDMPTNNLNNTFNVYYLDTVQRKWIYDEDNSEDNKLLIAGMDTMLHQKYNSGFENIVFPKKTDPSRDNLMIDFNKDEFPELAFFEGVKFEFTDNDHHKNSSKVWEDVEVARQDAGHYLVTFIQGINKESFVTVPVLDEKDLNRSLEEYDKIRIKRLSKLKSITDSLNNLRAHYSLNHKVKENPNERIVNQIHKGEFNNAFNEYCSDNSISGFLKQGKLSRMIMIRQFGLHNFDRFNDYDRSSMAWLNPPMDPNIINSEKRKAHYFSSENKSEIKIENAYFIRKDFNGTYQFTDEDMVKFPVEMAKESDLLVVVTSTKEMLFLKNELKTIDYTRSDISFNMQHVSKDIKTSEGLKKCLSLF